MITQAELKELMYYDPETGVFVWRVSKSKRVKVGSVAGTLQNKGYIHIKINGRKYLAHRLAFLYMTGTFPEHQIDHQNGIRADNRWNNLREATNSDNQRNSGKQANNTSGYKGVAWNKQAGKWYAQCGVNGKDYHIGSFTTANEAHAAYCAFAAKYHGEFFNAGK